MMPATMLARALTIASLAVSVSLWGAACGVVDSIGPSTCDRGYDDPKDPEDNEDDQPLLYVDGTVGGDGVFKSEVLGTGELLDFPGGAYYKIAHHLESTPDWTVFYLSFSRYASDEGGVYAQATGNQAVLVFSDEEFLWVLNDSCSDYYLRVVAGTGNEP